MITKTLRRTHSLSIRKLDNTKPITIDAAGQKWISTTDWIEVAEINLGSKANPNKEVVEFKFEPINEERPDTPKINAKDFFGRFFGGLVE